MLSIKSCCGQAWALSVGLIWDGVGAAGHGTHPTELLLIAFIRKDPK